MDDEERIPPYMKKPKTIKEMMDYEEWLEVVTPKIEKLGFCIKCGNPMASRAIEWNDGAIELGRICTYCGYDSEFHYEIMSTFVKEVKERKITHISVWYGDLRTVVPE